jgi:GH15 family glucan-1,4-alpha-glucosidase
VAAPTTSLPEKLGGIRNWDYRYCWIRDSTFTLLALINSGFKQEAAEWREWLLRAIAGDPAQLNIMYGICGERRLPEIELPWLPGYEQSQPVRIGNAAYKQFQLDVFGEVMDTLYHCRRLQFCDDSGPHIEPLMMEFLATAWQRPDEGIWEVRGGARQFTHSKMMAWVAFDRAIRSATELKVDGPVKKWRKIAHEIHSQICELGFDKSLNSFVQSYGSKDLDASLLMMPLVGFLPATDPRVLGTVKAIEQNLMRDGLIDRYSNRPEVDGLPPGEGSFLPCTFWLADNYILQNRVKEARHIFQRLLDVRNDVGLLSEEYDSDRKRLLGNFPQAFSHIALINTAWRLANHGSETKVRRESSEVQDVPAKVRSQV